VDAILIGLAAFLLLGSVAALEMRHLLSAVITVGLVGMGLSILFLLLGAPDIAITQVVVEVIVVTVMIRATARTADEDTGRPRSAGAIALGLGSVVLLVLVCVVAFAALPAFGASRPTPSDWYLAEALGVTGASNVVTSIVLDFRGYDTLGEATVILVAVAGTLVIARHVEGDGAADGDGPDETTASVSRPSSEEAPHAS
jgi:multisubunit Na+/H+ antiporter MnhB subunit